MTDSSSLAQARQLLPQVMGRDYHRLRRQLQELAKRQDAGQAIDKGLAKLSGAIAASAALHQRRVDSVPLLNFPENLPIAAKREQISAAIAEHQVVVVAGETGSGKTTQLPKICLELGRGRKGLIGHTQPRRIAARTVAARIAEEVGSPLGEQVGYQVRFTDHSGPETYIKLMTDGILLAEIQHDRFLNKYDTIIIDEAHERSLNIDFLLGYLKTILPKRPDLKVIITSATIDVERFSQHFNQAPIIEVSGRTYPVEVLYRPMADRDSDDQDINRAIVEAVEEIGQLEKASGKRGGDVLVFLSGEREIREAALAIRKANFPHFEVLPLYARLSLAEQNKVFQGHKGRRIVLATNVAETSITVPGIRYVIDPGTARISRYSYKTKVQRLPIEAVSQASANQRMGRCGRVSEGLCIRLYSEEDFLSRPEFTDAEILRTNLGAVILQMLQMRIGDVRRFPFVDAPDSRLISDGFKLLHELQAIDNNDQLSPMGRQISRLNIDPSLARMVLAAANLGCLEELLIIASALSIQDPRERPAEKKQQADEKHRRFKDDHSDFVSLINLWHYAESQRQELSQNQWRKQCKREFLSYLRLREWRDIHTQLRLALKDLKLQPKLNKEAASYENIHRALITGLLGRIGNLSEEREYLGARNRKFSIFPGSGQYKKRPKWLVAAELIETSQLFAHTVAKIEPDWALAAAKHLIKRSYFEPHYNSRSGQVMAFEKIGLYGLVLVEKQRVNYSQIDPAQCRELFIRQALVEGKYPQSRKGAGLKAPFFKHNQALLQELQDLEAKSRRRDILVDDEVLYGFYQERIPEQVVNLAGFEHWRKQAEQQQPKLLYFERELLMRHSAEDVGEAQFPDIMEWEGLEFLLSYHFDPKAEDDGVSLHVPVGALHLVPEARLEWLVPGLLREKCIALVKGLPKTLRKHFVPVPNFVDKALAAMSPQNRPLWEVLAEQLKRHTAVDIGPQDWSIEKLDSYYRLNIKVEDERGRLIEQGRDLLALRERYKDQVQKRLQDSGSEIERGQITDWDFGELAKTCQLKRGGVSIRAYPALVDEGKHTAIRLQDNPLEAEDLSRRGLVRLALLQLGSETKNLQKNLLKGKDLGLSVANMGSRDQVMDDLLSAAVAELLPEPWPRQGDDFNAWLGQLRSDLGPRAQALADELGKVLVALVGVKKTLKSQRNNLAMAYATADINHQLGQLFYPGCLYQVGAAQFGDYLRYLKGLSLRLDKVALNVQRDRLHIHELEALWEPHQQRLEKLGGAAFRADPKWQEYRWLIEEMRISLFAQSLKTRVPVSSKRLNKLWVEISQA